MRPSYILVLICLVVCIITSGRIWYLLTKAAAKEAVKEALHEELNAPPLQ